MKRRTRRLLVTVGVVVTVAVVTPLTAFAVVMSGGLDELFRRTIDPRSERVERARAAGRTALDHELEVVLDAALLAGSGNVEYRRVGDTCDRGQHNWKIDDDWDLSCRLSLQLGLAAGPVSQWRNQAITLHQGLVEAGWHAAVVGLDRLVSRWDTLPSRPPLGPAGLSNATYENVQHHRIDLRWAVQGDPQDPPHLPVSGSAYEDERTELAWQPVAAEQMRLYVTAQRPYFTG